MPYLSTDDGVRLYYEEAGSGTPIVFVHEFAGVGIEHPDDLLADLSQALVTSELTGVD